MSEENSSLIFFVTESQQVQLWFFCREWLGQEAETHVSVVQQ